MNLPDIVLFFIVERWLDHVAQLWFSAIVLPTPLVVLITVVAVAVLYGARKGQPKDP